MTPIDEAGTVGGSGCGSSTLLLRAGGEAVCVCEFEPFLGLSQGTVSHHLRVLVEAGLVEREGRGTRSYFSLVDGALDSVRDVFAPAAVGA